MHMQYSYISTSQGILRLYFYFANEYSYIYWFLIFFFFCSCETRCPFLASKGAQEINKIVSI